MRLNISHITTYHYDDPVDYALQQLRVTPKDHNGQTIIEWETHVEGGKKELEFEDQHHNRVELISFKPGLSTMAITCKGIIETNNVSGIIGKHKGYTPLWYFHRQTGLTKPGPQLRALLKNLEDDEDQIAKLHAISRLIIDRVSYVVGETGPETTSEQAIDAKRGVCQDHAHIFLSAARLLGYPARYVSGYLMMDDRVDQDASHAWAEVYIEDIGWTGFDVSNGISPDERYVRVATGLDYRDAAPVTGVRLGDSQESMIVTLQVQQ